MKKKGAAAPEAKADDKPVTKAEKQEAAERHEDDSIKWRSKYKVSKEEHETYKAKTESEKQDLANKFDSTTKERQMFEQKYINAELKAHAVAAGIKDMEFVKLIDMKDVKVDEHGNVTGVEKAIEETKTRKPEWFGAEKKTATSKNSEFPDKGSKTPFNARDLSKEDWKKNKQNYMAGNLPR